MANINLHIPLPLDNTALINKENADDNTSHTFIPPFGDLVYQKIYLTLNTPTTSTELKLSAVQHLQQLCHKRLNVSKVIDHQPLLHTLVQLLTDRTVDTELQCSIVQCMSHLAESEKGKELLLRTYSGAALITKYLSTSTNTQSLPPALLNSLLALLQALVTRSTLGYTQFVDHDGVVQMLVLIQRTAQNTNAAEETEVKIGALNVLNSLLLYDDARRITLQNSMVAIVTQQLQASLNQLQATSDKRTATALDELLTLLCTSVINVSTVSYGSKHSREPTAFKQQFIQADVITSLLALLQLSPVASVKLLQQCTLALAYLTIIVEAKVQCIEHSALQQLLNVLNDSRDPPTLCSAIDTITNIAEHRQAKTGDSGAALKQIADRIQQLQSDSSVDQLVQDAAQNCMDRLNWKP